MVVVVVLGSLRTVHHPLHLGASGSQEAHNQDGGSHQEHYIQHTGVVQGWAFLADYSDPELDTMVTFVTGARRLSANRLPLCVDCRSNAAPRVHPGGLPAVAADRQLGSTSHRRFSCRNWQMTVKPNARHLRC
jgi:hypothetical protein